MSPFPHRVRVTGHTRAEIKNGRALGVILLSEYHANSIRLSASYIALQWYLAFAKWYSLCEFEGE